MAFPSQYLTLPSYKNQLSYYTFFYYCHTMPHPYLLEVLHLGVVHVISLSKKSNKECTIRCLQSEDLLVNIGLHRWLNEHPQEWTNVLFIFKQGDLKLFDNPLKY